jgi:hypothetical protein
MGGMNLLEVNLHEELKRWLIELGKGVMDEEGKTYYDAWSGDSKGLPLSEMNYEGYHPDVIWKHQDKVCAIEIARTEESRTIVGEITLAKIAGCDKVLIITPLPEVRWRNYFSSIGEKLGLRHGVDTIFIPFNLYNENKIDEIKELILTKLRETKWVG